MKIILIPGDNRRARPTSLSPRRVHVLGIMVVAVPLFVATLTFQATGLLSRGVRADAAEQLRGQQKELRSQRATIEEVRTHTQIHLNALAQQLGQLQAQILRLNALGKQVARVAGVDGHEFDFRPMATLAPAKEKAADKSNGGLLSSLDDLDRNVARQSEKLGMLEDLLTGPPSRSGQISLPAGWRSSRFRKAVDPLGERNSTHTVPVNAHVRASTARNDDLRPHHNRLIANLGSTGHPGSAQVRTTTALRTGHHPNTTRALEQDGILPAPRGHVAIPRS